MWHTRDRREGDGQPEEKTADFPNNFSKKELLK
jgi:hypothetical protein